MTSELFIDVQPKKISLALTEDKRLMEYQEESQEASFQVGNIYLAKVKKIMPGLNSCFVNVGYDKDAFLHYLDLGPKFNTYAKYMRRLMSDRKNLPAPDKKNEELLCPKDGSIQHYLQQGQELLVQIVKEPISTKGPRLTCELSFAGRFLVLIPFEDKVNVSAKIKNPTERARLKQVIESIKPQGCGIIVRTVAEGKKASELDNEMKILSQRWTNTLKKAQKAKEMPTLVYEESSRAVGLLRDLFNPSYEGIYVNREDVFQEIKDYVSLIAPERTDCVKMYRGSLPIFDNFDITRQIKSGFGTTVTYKGGAYLIIEHTEALHVIDVNSGNRTKKEDSQEANALEVNLGAADEIARQLRLRDMGGIIIVDFIDMKQAESKQTLYERMVENMKQDRTRHNILPLTKFGLMQITRQRVRPETDVKVEEVCPTCHGTGNIKSSLLFTKVLEGKIQMMQNHLGIKNFTLHVHPYVYAYICQGICSLKMKWQWRYGFGIKIIPSQKLGMLQYEFYDQNGQEIDVKEEIEIR
jgi:ribonuclease G